jgi:hypothetical protein
MMSLPYEFRRNQKLAATIIQREWPELLKYPFNEYTGIGWLKSRINHASGKISDKLRKH